MGTTFQNNQTTTVVLRLDGARSGTLGDLQMGGHVNNSDQRQWDLDQCIY